MTGITICVMKMEPKLIMRDYYENGAEKVSSMFIGFKGHFTIPSFILFLQITTVSTIFCVGFDLIFCVILPPLFSNEAEL